tara:strand:- start:2976 stop:3134 length:159 start_codon:yes stop_codon:yes gene_type:complete
VTLAAVTGKVTTQLVMQTHALPQLVLAALVVLARFFQVKIVSSQVVHTMVIT